MTTPPQDKHTDALERAFAVVKSVEAREGSITQQDHQAELARLWVGLAIAVELRKLRTLLEGEE